MLSKHISPLTWLRRVAIAEGALFLVLLAAAPLAFATGSHLILTVAAVAFGVAFLVYFALAFDLWVALEWSTADTAFVTVGAVLPTGAFVVERWLRAQQAELEAASEFVRSHHLLGDAPGARNEPERVTEITLG